MYVQLSSNLFIPLGKYEFCLIVINGMVDLWEFDKMFDVFYITHKLGQFLISSHLHNNGDDEMCDFRLVKYYSYP